jgi:hypothetical protein
MSATEMVSFTIPEIKELSQEALIRASGCRPKTRRSLRKSI